MYFQFYCTKIIRVLGALWVLCMMLFGVAYAQMPAAGYLITNEASAQFIDDKGASLSIKSPVVRVTILPVLAATLTQAPDAEGVPNQTVYWPHTLTNTGNADDNYRFTVSDVGGDSGILKNIQLIHDVNKNGVFDAGDVVIDTTTHTESLSAGQNIALLVAGQLPATISTDSQFKVSLRVTASQGVPVLEQTDVVLTKTPQISLTKNVDKTKISLNEANKTLVYSLTFANTGSTVLTGTSISIDSANEQKVVFEDSLPTGLTLKSLSIKQGGGELLYHLKNEPLKSYHRYNTATLPPFTNIDRVAIAYSSFAANQQGQLNIEVDVTTQQAGNVNNQFVAFYNYGSEVKEALSNVVTTVLEAKTYNFELSSANKLIVVPSQPVVWKHIVKNTGQANDVYTVTATNLTNDNTDAENLQVFEDTNNNGFYDVGVDKVLTNDIALDVQQQAVLFVVGKAPSTAKPNDKINVDVSAKGKLSGLLKQVTDPAEVRVPDLDSKNDNYTLDKNQALVKDADSDSLYLEANVQLCNTNTTTADKVLLRVRSFAKEDGQIILDEEFVVAQEKENDNGIFRLMTPLPTKLRRDPITQQFLAVTKHNAVLESITTDTVEVIIEHCLEDDGTTPKKDAQNQDMKVYKDFVTKEEVKKEIAILELANLKSKNASYATVKSKILANQSIFLETNTEQCNNRADVADKLLLRVHNVGSDSQAQHSTAALDEEFVVAIETGKDTGLFRLKNPLPTRSRLENAPMSRNTLLETIAHDKIFATIMHCLADDETTIKKDKSGQDMLVFADPVNKTGEVFTSLLVDPFGVVFDSKTGKLLNGATVKLIRIENGIEVPFKLLDDNEKECEVDASASAACKRSIVTGTLDINGDGVVDAGDDGMFRFPLVTATDGINSFYRLVITAPDGYTYPSVLSPTELLANPATKNRVIHATGGFTLGDDDGSYGGRFNVLPTDGPVELDIPMDPPSLEQSILFVKKESSRKNAELGDFIDYTVVVRNTSISKAVAKDVVVTDTLPKGFSYVQGSARVNKIKQEPQALTGTVLRFNVGDISVSADTTLSYRVRIGVGALHSDGINRVVAKPSNSGASKVATATVKVTAGVFSQDAFVVGKVYTDCNRDGIQGLEEIGVPNVRLLLEDGTYVMTDVEGKFNFYGLRATTHVLKLDRTTLPQDVELIEQNVRNAGDPASRFVDLKAGEIHRADFAMTTDNATCSGPAMAEIFARRSLGDKVGGELERELKTELTFERSVPSDVRALPANGCVNNAGGDCGLHAHAKISPDLVGVAKTKPEEDEVKRVTTPENTRSLESYLEDNNANQLAILNLVDGQVLPYAQTRILFKGTLGAQFELSVNDKILDEKSMGIRMAMAEQRLEAREYVGINLNAGDNRIVLKQFDALGNVRGTREIVVKAPANLSKLQLHAEQTTVEANGTNDTTLHIKLQDDSGLPITTRTPITLESTAGQFKAKDLDPQTQGTQLFIEGGEFSVKLVSPVQPSDAKVRVTSGIIKREVDIRFVPELRPMIAAGIIEGMVSFKNFDSAKVAPAYANDGFEAELQSLSSSNDGKLNVGGRAAMFLKGKVKGDYLLTLAYDSNKEKDQRLFRDIRPDDYYPVYGDSAVRGFDAQSTSKLYVRLDKGRSYVMFGDYTTRIEGTEALSLGQYNRSLTGIRGQYATDTFKATSFVAQTKAKQQVIEIPAQGVSGPYVLAGIDGLKVNSEKVEIIKRDRNNPGLIIATEAKTRFSDYEFEQLSASLYFKAPIPSLDANLNPYFIRVTVEVEEDSGEDYWVGGVQAEQKIGQKVTVGAAAVQEDKPNDAYQLASANVTVQLTEQTKLIAEVAQSDRETSDVGQASRAELQHSGSRLNLRVYYGESDTDFDNPAAPLSSGRAESGVKANLNLNAWGTLLTEAIRTENTATGGVRQGVKATISRTINQYLTAELGSRYYDETAVPATTTGLGVTPYEGVTLHTKLNIQLPQLNAANFYGEYEQDIDNADRKILAFGGDYRINPKSKLYARHELASTLSSSFALNDQQQRNTTVFGIESDYMKDGRVFSEYRVRDAVNAQDVEAAMGLRNAWYLAEGVRLNTNFEEVRTLEGSKSGDAIAASVGLEYFASPLWKATGKIDLRWADSTDTILNTLGVAYKLSRDWTLLAKNVLNFTDNQNPQSGNRLQNRLQLGTAYRQVDTNRWDALTKIQYTLEDDKTNLAALIKKEAYIFSNHINYHPARRWTFANQLAAKWLTDTKGDLSADSVTYLVGGRITHDITERWETSLQAGWLSGDLGGQRTVLGAEVGYLVTTNLWVSGGYNWLSYDDADLVGTEFTVDGAYLRLRFKFDEDLFRGTKPATNKALEPK